MTRHHASLARRIGAQRGNGLRPRAARPAPGSSTTAAGVPRSGATPARPAAASSLASSIRQPQHRVEAGHSQWLKVLQVSRQHHMAGVLRQRGDGHIGKARIAARSRSRIRERAGQSCSPRVQRQYPFAMGGHQIVEPMVEAVRALDAAGAAQLGNPLGQFADRDARNQNSCAWRACSQSAKPADRCVSSPGASAEIRLVSSK